MMPDEVEEDEASVPSEEISSEPEDDVDLEELPDSEIPEDLPDIPRPPLKLSKEDWKVLDSWMRDYIEGYFDAKMQDFAITDEPSPREEGASTDMLWELQTPEEPLPGAYTPATIEGLEVNIREFGVLTPNLLEKAMTRKVLYSNPTHEFLFGSKNKHRETIAVSRSDTEPHEFVESVVHTLLSAGMTLDAVKDEGGFSFVLLKKEDIRAALSIGASGLLSCVSLVVTADSRKEATVVTEAAGKLGASK
jgi:hypothetical protein